MSNVSAAVNSRDLIMNSQRVLDKDAIIGLSFDMKKGNEQPLMYTLNEMNGNFFENNDEFYRVVTKFKFSDLNILYANIVNEARVLRYSEMLMVYINEYFNLHFMTCLYNHYKYAPSFFNALFPVNIELIPLKNKNIHLSFQKYYYMICLIQYVNEFKEDDKMRSLPVDIYENIINWATTRYDPNIKYQIEGPKKNQLVTFDFAKHYETLISINNTNADILNYNKLVKLQNINDNAYALLQFLTRMDNAYVKLPDIAREYVVSIDTISLYEKEIVDNNGSKDLIFDLAYIDFGDTINDATSSRMEDIDLKETKDITTTRLNIKKLEKIFNNYSRMKIVKMIVNKNTYKTDLSQLGKVFVVFDGVHCGERTIVTGKDSSLSVPGYFIKNQNGDFEFQPYFEYTSYIRDRTRIMSCRMYLTTDKSHNISNRISPYIIKSNVNRTKIYNVPLKMVDTSGINGIINDRFNKQGQFPDLLFRRVADGYDIENGLAQAGEAYNTYLLLSKEKINKYYKDKVNDAFLKGTLALDKEIGDNGSFNISPGTNMVLIVNFKLVDEITKYSHFMYKYDRDTALMNIGIIASNEMTNIDINNVIYNAFMNMTEMKTINRVYDTINDYRNILMSQTDNENINKTFNVRELKCIKYDDIKIDDHSTGIINRLNLMQYEKKIQFNYSVPFFSSDEYAIKPITDTIYKSYKEYFNITCQYIADKNMYLITISLPYTSKQMQLILENNNIQIVNVDNTLLNLSSINEDLKVKYIFTKNNKSLSIKLYNGDMEKYTIDEINNAETDIIITNQRSSAFSIIDGANSNTYVKEFTLVEKSGNGYNILNYSDEYSILSVDKYFENTYKIYTNTPLNQKTKLCSLNNGLIDITNGVNNVDNTDKILYLNPLYCDTLLINGFDENIIYNNLTLCDINEILEIEHTKDIKYYNFGSDDSTFKVENCYYVINGVKTYARYLNLMLDSKKENILYNCNPSGVIQNSNKLQTNQISIYKSTEYCNTDISYNTYVFSFEQNAWLDNVSEYNLKKVELNSLDEYGTSDIKDITNVTLRNILNYENSQYDGLLKDFIQTYIGNGRDFSGIVSGLHITKNEKYLLNFSIFINSEMLCIIEYVINDYSNLVSESESAELFINPLTSNWFLVYSKTSQGNYVDIEIDRLALDKYIPSTHLYRNHNILSITGIRININDDIMYLPESITTKKSPYGHTFSVKNNKLDELNIFTMGVSNNNDIDIDYSTNISTFNIYPYFGNFSYLIRPVYYYRSFYSYSKTNNIIFEADEDIPVHEDTSFNEAGTIYGKNKNKMSFITNNLHNNFYELKNFGNNNNPNDFSITAESVNIYYNKSDIELSLNWN